MSGWIRAAESRHDRSAADQRPRAGSDGSESSSERRGGHNDAGELDTTAGLAVHPAAELFPGLEEGELEELAADIAAHGLRHPLAITPAGLLLDGRHRYRACRQVGVEPSWVTVTEDPWHYVVSVNLHRRHLTDTQRALIAAQLASRRRGWNQHHGCPDGGPLGSTPPPSQEQARELLGVSHGAMVRARRVQNAGTPALVAGVRAGAIPLTTASRIASEYEPERQDAYAAAVGEHGADPVATAPPAPSYGRQTTDRRGGSDRLDAHTTSSAGASGARAAVGTGTTDNTTDAGDPTPRIAELADRGCSSTQIGAALGLGAARVRDLARAGGIELRADQVLGRSRRVDPQRVIRETVEGLDALCSGTDLLDQSDPAAMDPRTAADLSASMARSLRRLGRLRRQLQDHATTAVAIPTAAAAATLPVDQERDHV